VFQASHRHSSSFFTRCSLTRFGSSNKDCYYYCSSC
jgi:hypothetical protein